MLLHDWKEFRKDHTLIPNHVYIIEVTTDLASCLEIDSRVYAEYISEMVSIDGEQIMLSFFIRDKKGREKIKRINTLDIFTIVDSVLDGWDVVDTGTGIEKSLPTGDKE